MSVHAVAQPVVKVSKGDGDTPRCARMTQCRVGTGTSFHLPVPMHMNPPPERRACGARVLVVRWHVVATPDDTSW